MADNSTGSGAAPLHVLVLGPSKTGTTGLYSSIKRGLRRADRDAISVFEPKSPDVFANVFILAPHRSLLTKTTMDKQPTVVPDPTVFDRRVMTVRDPRDILISALLFRPLTARSLAKTDESAVREFIDALRRKEADPAASSVRELFELAERLGIGSPPYELVTRDLSRQRRLMTTYAFHVQRYEDFVADELSGLSDYLGFAVDNSRDEASSLYGHIARSASSGDYAHWFVKDDVAYYDEMFGDELGALGYDRTAELAEVPVIDPATSSEYLQTRYEERRASLRVFAAAGQDDSWADRASDGEESVDRLVGFAEDGDAISCLRLAQRAIGGDAGPPDVPAALTWARLAAQLGLVDGMALTIELLERSDGSEPAAHRELAMWRVEHEVRAADARAAVAELELDRLRRSGGLRVGNQLVALARSPRRNARTAIRELAAIWRGRTKPGKGQKAAELRRAT